MTLREYLDIQHMSIATFASAIDASQETVRRYLNKDRRPSLKYLAKIKQVTDGAVRWNDFFEESE